MAGVDPTITIPSVSTTLDHGNLMKGQLSLGNPVNVTMKDKARDARGLVPLAPERGRDRVRRRHPRHVEPALPLRPGQGHRRRVPVRHQRRRRRPHELRRAEPRLCAARGRRHVQRPHGRGHRSDKAAHIYWRAQSVYQTEATEFPDQRTRSRRRAPTWSASTSTALSTGAPAGPSGQAITAADCAQVTQMIAAVELRTNPAQQCNFQPLLKPGEPACARARRTRRSSTRRLRGRPRGLVAVEPGRLRRLARARTGRPSSTLPGGRSGTAAFGVDPDARQLRPGRRVTSRASCA